MARRCWERAPSATSESVLRRRPPHDGSDLQADVVTARCDVASWQFGLVIAFDWSRWASGAAPRINRGSITDALGGNRADHRRWNVRDVARRGAQEHRDQLRD